MSERQTMGFLNPVLELNTHLHILEGRFEALVKEGESLQERLQMLEEKVKHLHTCIDISFKAKLSGDTLLFGVTQDLLRRVIVLEGDPDGQLKDKE